MRYGKKEISLFKDDSFHKYRNAYLHKKYQNEINNKNHENKSIHKQLDKITHMLNGVYCRWRHKNEFPKLYLKSLNLMNLHFLVNPFTFNGVIFSFTIYFQEINTRISSLFSKVDRLPSINV